MQCHGCGSPKPVGEPESFAWLSFGIVPSDVYERDDPRYWQFSGLQPRNYKATFAIGFHGSDVDDGTQPFPGQFARIELDSAHPRQPHGELVPLQTEYYFCSVACMRSWFVRITERLESQLQCGGDDRKDFINPVM